MLVQFKVGNYLSFKEPQTLSLVASSDTRLPDNSFTVPGFRDLSLLKSVAIYGANGSGKSNLLKALMFMRSFVEDSFTRREGKPIPVTPFRLDPGCAEEPSEFEMVFVHDGERYVYGFTTDRQRVHEEWLWAKRAGSHARSRRLFHRSPDGSTEFGSQWRGRAQVLAEQTPPDALLLSVAAKLQNPIARKVVEWFRNALRDISEQPETQSEMLFTAELIRTRPELAKAVCRFLQAADLGIEGCEIAEVPLTEWFGIRGMPDDIRSALSKKLPEGEATKLPQPRTVHRRTDGQEVAFDLMEDESGGTRRLFSLIGPFLTVLASSLVLVVDELDRRLHPAMTRFLVDTVHDAGTTPQLIFTTHDCTLLDHNLFRRDQIWFTEKKPDGSTELYSLWDYKVEQNARTRPDAEFQGRYLRGRYGAVPYIGEWSFAETTAAR